MNKVIRSDQISHSIVSDSATPWITARQASLSITNSLSLPKLMSIRSVMPSSHLILIVPFSSCPQSLSASGSFPMNQLFAWGSQSTGVSALASFLPKKSQGWSPSEWTGWISGNPYQVIISSWYWWTLNFSPSEWSMVLSLNYEFVLPWLLVNTFHMFYIFFCEECVQVSDILFN